MKLHLFLFHWFYLCCYLEVLLGNEFEMFESAKFAPGVPALAVGNMMIGAN